MDKVEYFVTIYDSKCGIEKKKKMVVNDIKRLINFLTYICIISMNKDL